MDAHTFDRLVAETVRRPTRRSTLRLLAAGLLAALLPSHATRAQRQDSDGDGLFDDDEVIQHATDPNVADTDGDGRSDGAEVAAGTNPRVIDEVPPPAAPAPPPAVIDCPAGQTSCGDFCTDVLIDHGNCGACGKRCSQVGENYNCVSGTCTFYCLPGLVDCGGYCADLQSDYRSCGICGHHCGIGTYGTCDCVGGTCVCPTDF